MIGEDLFFLRVFTLFTSELLMSKSLAIIQILVAISLLNTFSDPAALPQILCPYVSNVSFYSVAAESLLLFVIK